VTDITERLREEYRMNGTNYVQEAADLIERLREELDALKNQDPVAWRWLYDGKPDSYKCFPMPGPDEDIKSVALKSAFPRTVQYLYAAPKPGELL
jgi:hypothetical protein